MSIVHFAKSSRQIKNGFGSILGLNMCTRSVQNYHKGDKNEHLYNKTQTLTEVALLNQALKFKPKEHIASTSLSLSA